LNVVLGNQSLSAQDRTTCHCEEPRGKLDFHLIRLLEPFSNLVDQPPQEQEALQTGAHGALTQLIPAECRKFGLRLESKNNAARFTRQSCTLRLPTVNRNLYKYPTRALQKIASEK
jgi:hypothetical protein